MEEYGVFTTPRETETLRRCGIRNETASFVAVVNSKKGEFGLPKFIERANKKQVHDVLSVDRNIIIPVWCLNDLIQVADELGIDWVDAIGRLHDRKARITAMVDLIERKHGY